jgi:hypothetical protein
MRVEGKLELYRRTFPNFSELQRYRRTFPNFSELQLYRRAFTEPQLDDMEGDDLSVLLSLGPNPSVSLKYRKWKVVKCTAMTAATSS